MPSTAIARGGTETLAPGTQFFGHATIESSPAWHRPHIGMMRCADSGMSGQSAHVQNGGVRVRGHLARLDRDLADTTRGSVRSEVQAVDLEVV